MKEEINSYNDTEDIFEFDFTSNKENNIIHFKNLPLEPVKFTSDEDLVKNTYYFGYEFLNNDKASSKVRTKFFHELKFNDKFTSNENRNRFIRNVINRLHEKINIYHFDVVIFPTSRSPLNQHIIKVLSNITNMELNTYELVEKMLSEIKFEFKPFKVPRKYSQDAKVIINAKNILVLDDASTTGATLLQCLRSIRTLNTNANVVLFTLVGKKDIFG